MEALEQIPNIMKFLKDILARKKRLEEFEVITLTQECSYLLQNKIPHKPNDLRSFTIPCFIGTKYSDKTLCDMGASINLILLLVFKKLGVGKSLTNNSNFTTC